MKKKPVIVTIAIVAAAAILIGGGIYLYPHLVERTVSQIVKNDMNNILEINLINWDNAKRSAQVTDKEEIDDIVAMIKDLKAKKRFDQRDSDGGGLMIIMKTSNGEDITLSCWNDINGVKYNLLAEEKELFNISQYIKEKYGLNEWPEEEMAEAAE